jgi:Ca-activated chloride channel family protein
LTLPVLCLLTAGIAQQTGSVTGSVTDPAGAAIAGAQVELTSSQIGFERKSTTDSTGRYLFAGVPPGKYGLKVESPGFQIARRKIDVGAGAAVRADFALSLGSVSETVTVMSVAGGSPAGPFRPRIPAQGIRVRNYRFNTEQYNHFQENEFSETRRDPLSTFSADVDTASYSNVRRFLRDGRLPPPDSIRIEELVNYFSYDYAEPAAGEPFSVAADVAGCPWKPEHTLLGVGMRTRSVDVASLPAANLVFLIDVSGSMNMPNKLPLVKQSMRLLVEQLREQDRVGIVVYAGMAGMALEPTPGSEKGRILEVIDSLVAGGSTHGSQGIQRAYQFARESFIQSGNNRVILATDGDFNVGVSSDGELVRLIEQQRESGIFLTVLGFGMGNYKDSKMKMLADHGNGNYAYIDTLREARKVLVEQMAGTLLTVAKDVKLQVEFNPAHVKGWRLIGYESRVLRPEEFNDDKKDAGDLGAGTSVTALYELIPNGSAEKLRKVDDLRYQSTTVKESAKASKEVATVKFRYKRPDESESRVFSRAVMGSQRSFADAPAEMRFAAAVAEYGLLLRQSKFAAQASYEHAMSAAKQALGSDRHGHRAEFVELVRAARDLAKGSAASE